MEEMQRWMNESWTWASRYFQSDEAKRNDRIWSYLQDRVEPDWGKD